VGLQPRPCPFSPLAVVLWYANIPTFACCHFHRESITLLQNKDNVLPLDGSKALDILVVGPTANSLTYQSGGWTVRQACSCPVHTHAA
jgi:hypothetical protein